MKTKLWLDDIREPPDDSWVWVKSVKVCIALLATNMYNEISFDHDLGEEENGNDVAKFIEELADKELISRMKWSIHSQNPVGVGNIYMTMISCDRIWSMDESMNEREN